MNTYTLTACAKPGCPRGCRITRDECPICHEPYCDAHREHPHDDPGATTTAAPAPAQTERELAGV